MAMLLAAAAILAQPQVELVEQLEEAARRCESATAISIIASDETMLIDNGKLSGTARFTAATPLRIASNTKTMTAAAVLRLAEHNIFALDDAIHDLIAPEFETILRKDGYDPEAITLRQLLSHSAGLYSHGEDPRYAPRVFADPEHRWTMEEQIALMAEWGDPVGAPGERFQYSDSGYVLLGHIIERATGEPLGKAVRRLLGLDALALEASWWEVVEVPPEGAPARARQYVGDVDGTDVHGSFDLHGGGGLVMSPHDLARTFRHVVTGGAFSEGETLDEMLWQGEHVDAERYRLGVFVSRESDGDEVIWHSGFWGTVARHWPAYDLTIAGAVTQQQDFGCLMRLTQQAADLLQAPSGVQD